MVEGCLKGTALGGLEPSGKPQQASLTGEDGGLGCIVVLLALSADPRVGVIRHFAQQQQVIAPEGIGGFPIVAVFVEAGEGDVVTNASFGVVSPDCGFDKAEPDLVYGSYFVFHRDIVFGKQCHRPSLKKTG
jgi:hypothetical protein